LPDAVESLVLDLLEWIGATPRPYSEVLDAWRTSCPRLPVWETANTHGYVVRRREPGDLEVVILLSPAGEALLRRHRPTSTSAARVAD
jgi:hypothetical protein